MQLQKQASSGKSVTEENIIPFPNSNDENIVVVDGNLARRTTGANNYSQQFTTSLQRAYSAGRNSAVLLLKISDFQLLVESFGHRLGQQISEVFASRLQKSLRQDNKAFVRLDDQVEQIAEDKFAIILDHLKTKAQVTMVAQRLIQRISGNYQILSHTLHINTAIGIAIYPTDTTDAQELMRYAHIALRQADASESTRFQFFNQQLLHRQRQQVEMAADLEKALAENRFLLHYQPQYTLDSNKIAGMEALIRMRAESGDIIAPDQFIPIAEDTGMIVSIGNWVINEACQQLRRWRDAGYDLPRIAINVSPVQLLDDEIINVISKAVARAGLQYSDLELEITERRMMENLQAVEHLLFKLSQKGVHITVDDFGTGYSSLAYIAHLPLDTIKIDRSFLYDIISDQRAARIVMGIIAMANTLELRVVIEGIETKAQQEFLQATGCHLAQGYALARPQSADAIASLMSLKNLE